MYTNLQETKAEVLALWDSGEYANKSAVAYAIIDKYGTFNCQETSVIRAVSQMITDSCADKEIIEQNVKTEKSNQRLRDLNRIERKAFREYARVENAVSEYGKSLIEQLKKYGKSLSEKISIDELPKNRSNEIVGVIQLTDIHANELINMPHNQYNWSILSQRLRKQINESVRYFRFRGAKKVLIAFTGDLLNSDRRLDELLNQSTNRSKASVLLAHLLIQAILDVRNRGFEVDIVSVLGNESRVNKEMTFSNEAFSDNYDFTIMSMVKIAIDNMDVDGINFLSIDQMEAVVEFKEQNWLLMHDLTTATAKQDKTQSTFGRYLGRGVKLDFIIAGHIHSHRGTDLSCRSGSMAGSNSYNEHALNLIGRASGVCYVVDGKERFYQYIDLQHATNEGYEIQSQLETYHAKSEDKLKQPTAIFQVVTI